MSGEGGAKRLAEIKTSSQQILTNSFPPYSFDVLDLIIKKVYEKAIDEPAFGDMYASLCLQMSDAIKDLSFVKIVNYKKDTPSNAFDQQEAPFYWSSNVNTTDARVVGPFTSSEECVDAALDDAPSEPIDRGEMELELDKLVVEDEVFVKVMKRTGVESEFYTVFFAVADAAESGQSLSPAFDDIDACTSDANKKNSFKTSLLNKCQDEVRNCEERSDEFEIRQSCSKRGSMTNVKIIQLTRRFAPRFASLAARRRIYAMKVYAIYPKLNSSYLTKQTGCWTWVSSRT